MMDHMPARGSFDYLLEPRRDTTVVPPPVPPPIPPRREEPRRVHIVIEVPWARPKPRRPRGRGLLIVVGWLIVLCLLGAAHGQDATSYTTGGTTYTQGTDGDGRPWTSTGYKQGFTTYLDVVTPNGKMVHCSSYKQGFATITRCD